MTILERTYLRQKVLVSNTISLFALITCQSLITPCIWTVISLKLDCYVAVAAVYKLTWQFDFLLLLFTVRLIRTKLPQRSSQKHCPQLPVPYFCLFSTVANRSCSRHSQISATDISARNIVLSPTNCDTTCWNCQGKRYYLQCFRLFPLSVV